MNIGSNKTYRWLDFWGALQSTDPLFVRKVRDLIGLYLAPSDKALVLCVDEKAQIQTLDRTQPLLPLRLGQVERRAQDDRRHGTTSLVAAWNVKTGEGIGQLRQRHRALEFRKFLDTIEVNVPRVGCASDSG